MHMETISKMLVKDKIHYFKYIFLYSYTYAGNKLIITIEVS